ncbi:MAG: tyrosine recombinase XerC [Thermoplasmata archaeon]
MNDDIGRREAEPSDLVSVLANGLEIEEPLASVLNGTVSPGAALDRLLSGSLRFPLDPSLFTSPRKALEVRLPSSPKFTPALDAGSSSKFSGAGPPPPGPELAEATLSAVTAAISRSKIESLVLVEEAVGNPPRRWDKLSEKYVRARLEKGEIGTDHAKGLRWALRRFPRDTWRRAGVVPPPTSARAVRRAHILALRNSPEWAPKTRRFYLDALRGLLRWKHRAIAEEKGLWNLEGTALKRRWLERAELVKLWEACRDDTDRLIVGAAGFNGLRRVELLRLRVRDLNLALPNPEVRIWGKGDRFRTIPVSRHLYGALVAAVSGLKPSDRVFRFGRSVFDQRLADLGHLAGIPVRVSGHDLRRTFGRLAYAAEVPLVAVQNVYGHKSPLMTAYYIGADRDQMTQGLAKFERSLEREA